MDEFQGEERSIMSKLCHCYMPIVGGTSFIAMSSYVMTPNNFQSLFGDKGTIGANCLWFNTHLGIGLYIYSRKHMQRAPFIWRLLYSTFGTVSFNFGSVLFWAATKNVLPKSNVARGIVGIVTGVALLLIGKDYLAFVDKNTKDDEIIY